MDDNTRDVLIGLGGIAGTLGGIWLGWVLQGRRRFDDAKFAAYSRLMSITNEIAGTIDGLWVEGKTPSESPLIPPRLEGHEIHDARAAITLLGSRDADRAASQLGPGLMAFSQSREGEEVFEKARADFVAAVRKDLGR